MRLPVALGMIEQAQYRAECQSAKAVEIGVARADLVHREPCQQRAVEASCVAVADRACDYVSCIAGDVERGIKAPLGTYRVQVENYAYHGEKRSGP